jgi:oxygen-independent coproporphyrinogen-3 oxidase
LLSVLRAAFPTDPAAELTLEANPEDVSLDAALHWRDAGITRVSLGAQSFSDAALTWMHRTHDSAAIGRAMGVLREAGFEEVSLDLIFALPDSVQRDWSQDLERAIELRPAHISLYGLTVEPATPLGRWRSRGEVTEAPEERFAEEFLLAHSMLGSAGFEHYEVSSYARPGMRARHNSAYWRQVPYAGLGPGAHEFDGENRRWNARSYTEWLARVLDGADPADGSEHMGAESRMAEVVYLGLRTSEGRELEPAELSVVGDWVRAGWGTVSEGRLKLTADGWLRMDAIASALTHHRSR